MAGPDFAVALANLDKALSSIEAVIDPDRKRVEIAELGVGGHAVPFREQVVNADEHDHGNAWNSSVGGRPPITRVP